ncbi:MAG: cupin-like domain-containing protein [Pseudomonadota bacterium]
MRTLLLLSLVPFLCIARFFSGVANKFRNNPASIDVDVPRVPAKGANIKQLMLTRKPLILEGFCELLPEGQRADLKSLLAVADSTNDDISVDVYDKHAPYFLYTGDYNKKLLHSEEISFKAFLKAMFEERRFDDYAVYQLFFAGALNGEVGKILARFANNLRGMADTVPDINASGLWIGAKGVVTPLHWDAWQSMLIQNYGSKRVKLYAPEDIKNLYFLSPFAVGDRWSRLPGRSDETDTREFPRFEHATAYRGELQQGDMLLIPPFWPHEAEALEANIGMPFRFAVRPGNYFKPHMLRAVIEELSTRFTKPGD